MTHMTKNDKMLFDKVFWEQDTTDTTDTKNHDDTYYLVGYDITDSKLRLKVAKELKGYGVRVQKSVFECKTSVIKFNKLIEKMNKMIQSPDSVRIYKLSKTTPIKIIGWQNPIFDDEDDYFFI